ncbi:MAG: bile acid:sodium symporter [Zavarzinia sp.]|nr:bile acid:sodium symporter [Zavarzinia sp.]
MKKVLTDPFLLSLFGMVVLAVLLPEPGRTGGFLHMEWVSSYGIAVVFFLYGLTLAPEKMRAGLMQWRLHLVVVVGTFVLFPLITLGAEKAVTPLFPPEIWAGFFYVAALPSTVSSSVAMTSMAKGNVPGALFNASLSSLIGVFATPALMAWYLSQSGAPALPLGTVILKIVLLVLLPTVIGQMLHRPLVGWATRHAGLIKLMDRTVILAIVYNSFCDSVESGLWQQHDPAMLVEIAVASVVLFFIVYGVLTIPCKLMHFNREDRIAALFCGSKKSLATGVPLAGIIFGANPALGLIIAPIMIYHFLQLVIVSVIANHHGTEAAKPTTQA